MKTASTSSVSPRSRAPQGVDSVLRINIALMPDERAELLRRATQDGRTNSAMARVFLLRGMQDDPKFITRPSTLIPRGRRSRLATSIINNGSQSNSAIRLLFCNHLISLAALESYPRRAKFIAAYSTGGTVVARSNEAGKLVDSFSPLNELEEFVVHCVEMANTCNNPWADFGNKPEII